MRRPREMSGSAVVPPLSVHGAHGVMLLHQFRPWFDALCADDVDRVEAMLTAATQKERDLLLNGLFDYRLVVLGLVSFRFTVFEQSVFSRSYFLLNKDLHNLNYVLNVCTPVTRLGRYQTWAKKLRYQV